MSSTSTLPIGRRGLALAVGFLVLSFLYSVLVAGQILAWVVFVVYLGGGAVALWLLWRFVVAVERIAGAAEKMARDERGRPEPADRVRDRDRTEE
ncbi:hypothetical protein ACFO0N_04435 [Halobium salinum]|uniref:Uncharacterized protein n=1 Tax=Halobium salinum TaxID=1364940 RepID=A0ABD5P8L9_9EURY|nr:hypothetical protein [Halobium salinum]